MLLQFCSAAEHIYAERIAYNIHFFFFKFYQIMYMEAKAHQSAIRFKNLFCSLSEKHILIGGGAFTISSLFRRLLNQKYPWRCCASPSCLLYANQTKKSVCICGGVFETDGSINFHPRVTLITHTPSHPLLGQENAEQPSTWCISNL